MARLQGSSLDEKYRAKMAGEVKLAWFLLLITVLGSVLFLADSSWGVREELQRDNLRSAIEQMVFATVLVFLLFGNLVYQLTRLGYLRRRGQHVQAPGSELDAFLSQDALPALTVLVPSYKEEADVVAQTLFSSALQQYPDKRIVLLIDDPPYPSEQHAEESLEIMRLLPAEVENILSVPARRVRTSLMQFRARMEAGDFSPVSETLELATLWRWVAGWYQGQADSHPESDHTDAFFVQHTFRSPGQQALLRAAELEEAALDEHLVTTEYRRLLSIFSAEITSFERKRYVNLSHEPNKAMNLNSYIGLLGSSFREIEDRDGLKLESSLPEDADLVVPHAEYTLTLDADSLLAPDYALRLIHHMERPGNERIGVIQTPYCAIPGAASAVERIAGATTDIQHILHQGSTDYEATFWVGANAVLRKKALDDIRVIEDERGFPVTRYIQDRTVIEDTESSIDLIRSGWSLYNYPDRLAVSATPPDFGSLIIQRGRWANGGLIILPKLFGHLFSGPLTLPRLREAAVRFYYLSSIAGVNLGLLILFCYPFAEDLQLANPWIPLAALPYFIVYSRDLAHSGYKKRDVLRVYALNLALLPINVAGVIRSIHQWITNKKLPFARTPKVSGRTGIPGRYLLTHLVILSYWAMASGFDLADGRWAHAGFGAVNIALLAYALVRFVGIAHAGQDLFRPIRKMAAVRNR